jgi:hypothetical protein
VGTLIQTSSSSAQFTAPTPALPSLTPVKIQACLTADKDFCGSLSLPLSPQVTIASVAPNAWPSGQPTAVTITGTGFGSSAPNVIVSEPLVNFSLSGFTNTQIQGTVTPPLIPSGEPVTLTVTSTSNPINSFATSGTIIINPAAVTVALFPTAATLLETQQLTFSATVGCKLANGSSCTTSVSPLVFCSINPNVGSVTPGPLTPATSCTITLTPLNVAITPLTVSLGGGQTQKFTQVVTGALNSNIGVTWSLVSLHSTDPSPAGTIDQSGTRRPILFLPHKHFLQKACSTIDLSVCGQAQVTLTPISVTVTPSAASLTPGATQQFTTLVTGTPNGNVTWSLSPSVGTISATGLYTAPPPIPAAQIVTVKACSVVTPALPNPCGTAVINLVAVPDFSVSATPTSQTVSPGGSAVYNVTVTSIDEFTGTVNFNCPVTPLTTGMTVSGCPISIPLASSPVSFPVTVTTVSSTTPQNYTITATGTAGVLSHSSVLTLSVAGPVPVFSPTALSFPDQNINTSSAPTPITLTNSGSAPLLVSPPSITGADSSNFGLTNNCPASLAANTSCTFTVIFAPTAVRLFSGTLIITDNAPGSPHMVSLSGKGVAPVPVFSAPTLAFAPQTVGTVSAPQSVTLTNAGTTPITGISAGSGFPQTNNCGTSLPAGASCTVTVSFAPVSGGLNLGSIAVAGSTTFVNLTGSGIPTLTGLTPARVTAGSDNFTLGLTGNGFTRTALVRVNGITRPSLPVDLQHLNVVITSSDVANIGSLNVSVVIPGTVVQESGTLPLTITSSPIPLIGNIVPARVVVGYQSPLKLIVNGSFFTTDSMVQINGATRPTTFISPNQLTAVLPASDFIASALPSITVINPAASVPANAATLAVFRYGDLTFDNIVTIVDLTSLANFLAGNSTLADPAPGDLNLDGATNVQDLVTLANFLAGNIHILPVMGDQTAFLFNAGATLRLSPPIFAGQAVGTASEPLTLQLTNGGPTSLSISGLSISPVGEFVQTNDCVVLAANTSCSINITFSPTMARTRSAVLTVLDSAGNSPQTATLSGTGIGSAAAPTATLTNSLGIDGLVTLTFSGQTMGTDSAARPLTLTNNGPTALSISGINIVPSGEFAESDNCGTSLPANASCTINVSFSPAASGTRTATLTVTDNASNSPQTANLIGTGATGGDTPLGGPKLPPPGIDN